MHHRLPNLGLELGTPLCSAPLRFAPLRFIPLTPLHPLHSAPLRSTPGRFLRKQGLRCKASHKDRVLPPLDGPGGVALSRRTDTDSRASQPRGVLRTAAGGRDPATARDRESNSATCNSPPLLVRPAQAQCHAYPVAVVWLKGDSVPPQAERG